MYSLKKLFVLLATFTQDLSKHISVKIHKKNQLQKQTIVLVHWLG